MIKKGVVLPEGKLCNDDSTNLPEWEVADLGGPDSVPPSPPQ